jgi:hypothetical protein
MLTSMVSERPCKPFPKVRSRVRIVEYISNAQHGIYRVAARDVEDPRNHIHTCPRQLFLSLVGERWEAPPEMPIGGVQQPQHDVSGFGAAILNAAWNSRVTVGAR